jgi:putative peptidoglycan lipid II flippase
MVMPEAIVRVLFGRGAFDETSVRLTSQALLFYAIGLPAHALAGVLDSTFISLKDTRTPTKLSLLRIGVKIVLSYLLIRPLAHAGLALAESLSQIIKVSLLILYLPERLRRREVWKTAGSFARTLAASFLMGALIYLVQARLNSLLNVALGLAALILLGAVTYAVIALLFQKGESRTLLAALNALRARYVANKS